ncbi:MAG: transketolase family protein, partial [Lentisphaerae bacterium]|nr:transketolase family protein [Lentisphaerota bacterium]
GLSHLRKGQGACLVATGIMVHSALRVADALKKKGLDLGVIDLYRAAPIKSELLVEAVADYDCIITLEEHFVVGGIGDALPRVLAEAGMCKRLHNIALPHKYLFEYGGRRRLHELTGLDDESLAQKIVKIIGQAK